MDEAKGAKVIIPFLDGFLPFRKIPVTWILILFNMFIFSQNYGLSQVCHEQFMAWYEDETFINTQGHVYLQYKGSESPINKVKDIHIVGKMAFKDEAFLQKASVGKWVGDDIAIAQWKKDLEQYLILRDIYPAFFYGVSGSNQNSLSFVSYQFFHEGFWHLLGNILLIMLVGGFLERRYSGYTVFSVYLLSGFTAAFIYSQTNHLTGAPLVGASGSLCGLLGFLFYSFFDKETRLFYFILPMKKYMGFIHIKTCYWLLWFCMLEDLAGWLAKPELFNGGTAHLVHLLGFLVGIALAKLIHSVRIPRWSLLY